MRRVSETAKQAPPAAPAAPAAPLTPKWPVNDPPAQPSISWNGHTLRIDAMNASLKEILDEVSKDTGATVAGFGTDERIFGVYGPGAPREVLAQLLDGTKYNVIIVGSRAEGAPLRIVLSNPPTGPAPAYTPSPEDTDYQPPAQPNPYSQVRPGMVPGQPPRTPQQVYEEMQQREEQMREMQLQRHDQPPQQ